MVALSKADGSKKMQFGALEDSDSRVYSFFTTTYATKFSFNHASVAATGSAVLIFRDLYGVSKLFFPTVHLFR
eukprot:SAG11_NODE_1383_length_5074_cov_41.695276_2_plen_73_part_00